jgi:hypothetical protein
MYNKSCPVCKNNFITKYIKQIYCSNKCFEFSRRKVERPSKEQLEEMLRTYSMVKIGRIYGVSDKSVKKWMNSYGILDI